MYSSSSLNSTIVGGDDQEPPAASKNKEPQSQKSQSSSIVVLEPSRPSIVANNDESNYPYKLGHLPSVQGIRMFTTTQQTNTLSISSTADACTNSTSSTTAVAAKNTTNTAVDTTTTTTNTTTTNITNITDITDITQTCIGKEGTHQITDASGNIIGYDFDKMVLIGDNAIAGKDLFIVGSIWKDKKSLKTAVSIYLSRTGREMTSIRTVLCCNRYGHHVTRRHSSSRKCSKNESIPLVGDNGEEGDHDDDDKSQHSKKRKREELKIGCTWVVEYKGLVKRRDDKGKSRPNFEDGCPVEIIGACCEHIPQCMPNSRRKYARSIKSSSQNVARTRCTSSKSNEKSGSIITKNADDDSPKICNAVITSPTSTSTATPPPAATIGTTNLTKVNNSRPTQKDAASTVVETNTSYMEVEDIHQLTDTKGKIIGYDFDRMVLTGDNAVKGEYLFVTGSTWKDKKSLKTAVAAYLSRTGRVMTTEKTIFCCNRYGYPKLCKKHRNKEENTTSTTKGADKSEYYKKRTFKDGDLKIGCTWAVEYKGLVNKRDGKGKSRPNFEDGYPVQIIKVCCEHSSQCVSNFQTQKFIRSRSGKYAKNGETKAGRKPIDTESLRTICNNILNNYEKLPSNVKFAISGSLIAVEQLATHGNVKDNVLSGQTLDSSSLITKHMKEVVKSYNSAFKGTASSQNSSENQSAQNSSNKSSISLLQQPARETFYKDSRKKNTNSTSPPPCNQTKIKAKSTEFNVEDFNIDENEVNSHRNFDAEQHDNTGQQNPFVLPFYQQCHEMHPSNNKIGPQIAQTNCYQDTHMLGYRNSILNSGINLNSEYSNQCQSYHDNDNHQDYTTMDTIPYAQSYSSKKDGGAHN